MRPLVGNHGDSLTPFDVEALLHSVYGSIVTDEPIGRIRKGVWVSTLQGKVAIVTGASAGIGEGLARMLAAEGVAVALAARREDELARVAAAIRGDGGTALVVPTNVREQAALEGLVARTRAELGPISILVNNAGVARNQPIHETKMKV